MKRLLGLLCALLFSVPAFADQCNMLPSMDTWSNGGTQSWVPTLYTTQKTFSFPITLLSSSIEGGYKNIPVKLVKVKPNTKYTLYTDVSASSGDKFGWEYAGYKTEADAYGDSSVNVNSHATFSQGAGSNSIHKVVTFTTTADTEYMVVSPTNWGSGADVTLTAESKIIMVEGDSITNTNIPQCGATTLNSLPSGYQQLEYLEGTGTQAVDTGLVFNKNNSYQVSIDFMPLATNSAMQCVAGCEINKGNWSMIPVIQANSQRMVVYQSANVAGQSLGTLSLNRKYSLVMEQKYDSFTASLDGTQIINQNNPSSNITYSSVSTYSLFADHYESSTGYTQFFKGRIYSAKIVVNDVITRQMVPARRVSDGVLGMYDLADSNANTAFHTNAGTGTFIAGPTIIPNTYERLQWIQTSGQSTRTQYIDTGVVFDTLNTKVEIGADIISSGRNLFGFNAPNTDTNWYTLYDTAFSSYFANSTSSTLGSLRAGTSGVKRDIVVTTNSSNQLLIDVNGTNVIDKTFTGTFIVNNQPSVAIFTTNGNIKNSRITTGTKVWYTRLYKDGDLVFNGVPVKRLSDGEVGMFDTVTGAFLTNSGTGDFVAGPSAVMKIATTKYNTNAFSGVVTALNNAVDTIKTVVANTINQATAVANLQSGKQQRPDESCPAGKTCLLVEDMNGDPHWYEIVESYVAPNTLPAGYTELQYIESTGTQYIDDIINLKANYSFEMKYKHKTSSGYQVLFAIYDSTTGYSYGYMAGSEKNYIYSKNSKTFVSAYDTTTTYTLRYDGINKKIYSNGTEIAEFSELEGFSGSTGVAPRLFQMITGEHYSTNFDYPFKGYAYGFKVWDENNTLVRNLVPAQQGNTVGMYDTVNGIFYSSSSSTAFNAGPVAQ